MAECTRCGDCCRHFALLWPGGQVTPDDEKWVALHGLEIRLGVEHNPLIIIPMPCSALTSENQCAIYDERPDVCRGWPYDQDDLLLEPRCTMAIDRPREDA